MPHIFSELTIANDVHLSQVPGMPGTFNAPGWLIDSCRRGWCDLRPMNFAQWRHKASDAEPLYQALLNGRHPILKASARMGFRAPAVSLPSGNVTPSDMEAFDARVQAAMLEVTFLKTLYPGPKVSRR